MAENTEPLALVIDDQEDIVEIVALTLKYEGWRVATARNGREGIEAVRKETPELILADLMMPEMTGIEFCRRLVEDFKLSDVPVLMISGVNEKAKILADFWNMPLRHHNFLHKPFSAEELLAAVQSILPRGHAKAAAAKSEQSQISNPPSAIRNQPSAGVADGGVRAPSEDPQSAIRDSQPDGGSGRDVRAPSGNPQSPSKIVAPFKPEAGRGFRILVVDDDPDIRMILKTTLSMFHVVEEADNGMAGLEMVDHFGPDIVISDVNMPQMNGLEMAAAIRRHPAYCLVPIFFLTGETDRDLPRKAFDIGGNLYLRKPVDPIQLLKFIDRFLQDVGLQPGQLHSLAEKNGIKISSRTTPAAPIPISGTAAPAKAAPTAPAKPAAATPTAGPRAAVRVLVIDSERENLLRVKGAMEGQGGQPSSVAGGPFEMFYSDELPLALGNLARWEPDLILYNPRTPGMADGVAFGQTLKLRKLTQMPEMAFIGSRFLDSELEYSRVHFNRSAIKLDGGELAKKLGEAVLCARTGLRPKQFSYRELCAEEAERQRKLKADNQREALQREELRKRYASLQDFIDRQL